MDTTERRCEDMPEMQVGPVRREEREETVIPEGYCLCGCGQKTRLAPQTITKQNIRKGQPFKFITGHNSRVKGYNTWNGGTYTNDQGYSMVYDLTNPRSQSNGYIREHIAIVEKILGYPLPAKARIHHVNEDPKDNRPRNLVVCENNVYHMFLHQRMRAYKACGHAHWRKCSICKQYDDPLKMYVTKKHVYHRECSNLYQKKLRKRKMNEKY